MNRAEAPSNVTGWRKLFQGGVLFILHQYIGTLGIVISAAYLTAYAFDVLRLFGKPIPSERIYWVLTGTPYYPVQIGLGLLLGWLIGRHLQHRAMLWVWVLPFTYLTYAVVAIPTLVPNWIPPAYQAGIGESRFRHYFGWGCGGQHPCFDQAAITLLFYAAAAYSIGALLARRAPKRYGSVSGKDSWAFVPTGIIFLLVAVLELVRTIDQGWKWVYLGVVVMPAAIGGFLILYGTSLRGESLSEGRTTDPPVE